MANKQKEAEVAVKPKEKAATSTYVTKYNIYELAAAAKEGFGADRVVVRAALTGAGKEAYTMEEAKKIVTAFRTKEVKN